MYKCIICRMIQPQSVMQIAYVIYILSNCFASLILSSDLIFWVATISLQLCSVDGKQQRLWLRLPSDKGVRDWVYFGKQNEFSRFGIYKFMEMKVIVIENLTMAPSSFRKIAACEYGLSRTFWIENKMLTKHQNEKVKDVSSKSNWNKKYTIISFLFSYFFYITIKSN